MFDISFWELAIVGVIALLVIGPERLPAVARTVGKWVGKARRFISYVQADIKEEINKTEELKRLVEEQSQIKEVHEIIEHTVDETRQSIPRDAPLSKHTVKPFDETEPQASKKPKQPQEPDSNTATKAVNEQAK